MAQPPTTKKHPAQNVNSAQVKKSALHELAHLTLEHLCEVETSAIHTVHKGANWGPEGLPLEQSDLALRSWLGWGSLHWTFLLCSDVTEYSRDKALSLRQVCSWAAAATAGQSWCPHIQASCSRPLALQP